MLAEFCTELSEVGGGGRVTRPGSHPQGRQGSESGSHSATWRFGEQRAGEGYGDGEDG